MNCPACSKDTFVKDSRSHSGSTWRRRECKHCHHRFTTMEVLCENMPYTKPAKRVPVDLPAPVKVERPRRRDRADPVGTIDDLPVVKPARKRIEDLREQKELADSDWR